MSSALIVIFQHTIPHIQLYIESIDRRKRQQNSVSTRYLFSVMDGASQFILTHEISLVKKGINPTGLFAASAARSLHLLHILVSDVLVEFCKAATDVFEIATNTALFMYAISTYKSSSTKIIMMYTNDTMANFVTGCNVHGVSNQKTPPSYVCSSYIMTFSEHIPQWKTI